MARGSDHGTNDRHEDTPSISASPVPSPRWRAVESLPVAPAYRYRPRADGLVDETYRINFTGELTPTDIARIGDVLGRLPHEDRAVYGILALAKMDFTLEGTCECQLICSSEQWKKRVELFSAVWTQINSIHSIAAIDWTLWNRTLSE